MRNVVLCGKATVEDLERAVLEQNAHLTEDELNDIRGQLADFKSYFYDTESSRSLIANMIEERPGFEFNNYNFRLRRTVLEADDEPREEENYDAPLLIASLKGMDESKELTASVTGLDESKE